MEDTVKIFKALAHPVRLKIIKKLMTGECCVCKLNEDVEFSQSNVSQHLRILKDARILIARKDGMKTCYSIKDSKILEIVKLVEDLNNK